MTNTSKGKKTPSDGSGVVFLVGSPRSGTTLLGEILNEHPQIGSWYEPSFVLDRFFRDAPHDRRTAQEATPPVAQHLQGEFQRFKKAMECTLVLDKSPHNSLKIPFLNAIFPDSKFIHILRDGRDAVLSIRREWQRRHSIAQGSPTVWPSRLTALWASLRRQPCWRYRWQAFWFFVGGPLGLFRSNRWLLQVRWRGRIGWGPRFPGWQDVIDKVSLLEFCALQWRNCVETILSDSEQLQLGSERLLTVRYEDLLRHPNLILERIFAFIGVDMPEGFADKLPPLKRDNFGKWPKAFTPDEKALIGPILQPLLTELGYADSDLWYRGGAAAEDFKEHDSSR